MGVDVERQLDSPVPEALGDHAGVLSGGCQERRARVPRVVGPERLGEARFPQDRLQVPARHVSGLQGLSKAPGEDQVVVHPRAARLLAHGGPELRGEVEEGGERVALGCFQERAHLIAAEQGLARSPLRREGLSKLLDHPPSAGIRRDVEVDQPSASMIDDEPDVHQLEAHGRDDAEVHGRDGVPVISEESHPTLASAWIG